MIVGAEHYPAAKGALSKAVPLTTSQTIITGGDVSISQQQSFHQLTPQLGSTVQDTNTTGFAPQFTPLDMAQSSGNFNLDDTLIMYEHPSGNVEVIEPMYGFSAPTYAADARLRQVVLTIKRNYQFGPSYVLLSTTAEGTAVPGRDFRPINDENIIFPDRTDSMSYVFKWGLDDQSAVFTGPTGETGNIHTINFVLTGPDGSVARSMDGASPTAVLIIEGNDDNVPAEPPKTEEESVPLFHSPFFLWSHISSPQPFCHAAEKVHQPLPGRQSSDHFRDYCARACQQEPGLQGHGREDHEEGAVVPRPSRGGKQGRWRGFI